VAEAEGRAIENQRRSKRCLHQYISRVGQEDLLHGFTSHIRPLQVEPTQDSHPASERLLSGAIKLPLVYDDNTSNPVNSSSDYRHPTTTMRFKPSHRRPRLYDELS
jgi:hypothetical protein